MFYLTPLNEKESRDICKEEVLQVLLAPKMKTKQAIQRKNISMKFTGKSFHVGADIKNENVFEKLPFTGPLLL